MTRVPIVWKKKVLGHAIIDDDIADVVMARAPWLLSAKLTYGPPRKIIRLRNGKISEVTLMKFAYWLYRVTPEIRETVKQWPWWMIYEELKKVHGGEVKLAPGDGQHYNCTRDNIGWYVNNRTVEIHTDNGGMIVKDRRSGLDLKGMREEQDRMETERHLEMSRKVSEERAKGLTEDGLPEDWIKEVANHKSDTKPHDERLTPLSRSSLSPPYDDSPEARMTAHKAAYEKMIRELGMGRGDNDDNRHRDK